MNQENLKGSLKFTLISDFVQLYFFTTDHILEGFPRSLQVIQVGSAGLHGRVIQLLDGGSA